MSTEANNDAHLRQVSVQRLFDDNRDRTGMAWVAGRQGGSKVLTGEQSLQPTIGHVGHMNFIHPFRIQVLGAAELAYLRALPQSELQTQVQRLFTLELVAIVVANGEAVPEVLVQKCNDQHVALFTSPQPSPHLVEVFRIYLSRVLAENTALHGVFLDVLEMGVLITGASAIGKSELALELISRGNGLVADDIVELYRISPDTIEGRCPAILRDFLEVRGIGVLNIRTIFGETAVRPRKLLKLLVHLEDHSNEAFGDLDRLKVDATYQEVLGVPIRKVTIPVAAGRNLAVLVEAAVRNFVLNQRGIDSTKEFIERQQRLMDEGNYSGRAMDLVLIGGVSGSGKSVALAALEDSGYYAVNNLPLPLLLETAAYFAGKGQHRVAVSLDVKTGPGLNGLAGALASLQASGWNVRFIYLDAKVETLVKRFSETRRRHPFSDDTRTLPEAIDYERNLVADVRELGIVFDTSELGAPALRGWIKDFISVDASRLTLLFESFGFKHGIPLDADLVFDVRCLPNPHYEPLLQPLTGRDAAVVEYLEQIPEVERMYADIYHFVAGWLPDYARDNRNYLTVAIGCTGGRHRSVYLVERLAAAFSPRYQVLKRHRETP